MNMVDNMGSIVQTTAIQNAVYMADTVMTSRSDSRAGQIIGDVGSGKTSAGWHLTKKFNAIRICAWARITRKSLLLQIADGTDLRLSGKIICEEA